LRLGDRATRQGWKPQGPQIHRPDISASGGASGETAKDAVAARSAATLSAAVKNRMATGRIVRGDSSLEIWLEDMKRAPRSLAAAIGFGFTTPVEKEVFLAKQPGFAFCQTPRIFPLA
jgi:hypothetical protein